MHLRLGMGGVGLGEHSLACGLRAVAVVAMAESGADVPQNYNPSSRLIFQGV